MAWIYLTQLAGWCEHGNDWIYLTHNRDSWQADVNTVTNLWVS